MHALPIHNTSIDSQFLNVWFQYQEGPEDGFTRLKNYLLSNHQHATSSIRRSAFDYTPLTEQEEERWKILERKAKQDNLTGSDAAEHEVLLTVQYYHRLRKEQPQLSHMQILDVIRKSI